MVEPSPRKTHTHELILAPPTSPEVIGDSTQCVICGYALRGLPTTGRCPECGTAIERSLRGNMLEYSSPAYLTSLHRGVFFIQAAIITQIILFVLLVLGALAMGGAVGLQGQWLDPLAGLLGLGVSAVSLYGWWLFSSPDPAYSGVLTGATARQVLRTVVIIEAAFAVVGVMLQFYVVSLRTAMNPDPPAAVAVSVLSGVASTVLRAIWFFSAMFYIRWLAPRIPNRQVDQRARLMMWLGPLLCTVGWLACGLGPLVALVLFYNMLDWVRKDIRRLRAEAERSFANA